MPSQQGALLLKLRFVQTKTTEIPSLSPCQKKCGFFNKRTQHF